MRISDWSSDVCSSDLTFHRSPHLAEPNSRATRSCARFHSSYRNPTWRTGEASDPPYARPRGRMGKIVREKFIPYRSLYRAFGRQGRWPRRYGRSLAAYARCSHPVQARAFNVSERRVSAEEPWSSRSEEHTSELQSLMRISYAVFCLKKKKQ